MIDSMFQEGTDRVLDDQVARPRAVPFKQPNFWAGWDESTSRGLASSGLSSAAFGTEILGAFGQVGGAYPEIFGGPLSGQQKQQSEQARRKLLDKGIDFATPQGDELRKRAREIMPDPNTTGTAAQVTAGLFGFAGKAIGYGVTLGPAAPLVLGVDVGFEESDRLKQQGVDLPTRTKAGAVAGALAGASLVAPMTGATQASRFVKGLAAGEGATIGQSLAEKAILNAAGYHKQADQFDPLDPVALAVGAVPGVLGAKFGHAVPKPAAEAPRPITQMGLTERQALPFNSTSLDAYAIQAAQREGIPPEILLAVKNAGEKSGSKATSPKGAQGVMQFMPDTFKEFGRGDPTDPINSIDAGARYLKKLHDAYGDWDAAVAHYNGGGSEAARVRSGAMPAKAETAAYLTRVREYLGKNLDDHAAAAVRADPTFEAAARLQQAADALDNARLTPDHDLAGRDAHLSALEMAGDQIARGEPVNISAAFGDNMLDNMRQSRLVDDHIAAVEDRRAQALGEAGNLLDPGGVRDLRAQMDALSQQAPDTSKAAAKERARQIQGDDRSSYKKAMAQAQQELATAQGDWQAQMKRLQDQLDTHGRAQRAQESVAHMDTQLDQLRQTRDAMDGPRTSPRAMALAIADAFRQDQTRAPRMLEPARQPQEAAHVQDARKAGDGSAEPATSAAEPQAAHAGGAAPAGPAAGISDAGPAAASEASRLSQATIDRAAAEVSTLNPDMLVQLDGMDAPVRVGDLMAQVSEEAARDKKTAQLVEVAASCFIRTGGA